MGKTFSNLVSGILTLVVLFGLIRFLTSDFVASIIPGWHTIIYTKNPTALIILIAFLGVLGISYLIFLLINRIIKGLYNSLKR